MGGNPALEPASDGQRFLLANRLQSVSPVPITVVLNWQAGLKNKTEPREYRSDGMRQTFRLGSRLLIMWLKSINFVNGLITALPTSELCRSAYQRRPR